MAPVTTVTVCDADRWPQVSTLGGTGMVIHIVPENRLFFQVFLVFCPVFGTLLAAGGGEYGNWVEGLRV